MPRIDTDEILKPVGATENARRERLVSNRFWQVLGRAAGQIPFAEEVVAGYYCAFDPKTPKRARGLLIAALVYFVMPFDIVPDFIVALGFTDDLAVLTAAVAAVRSNIKPRHRAAAKRALGRKAWSHRAKS